MGVATGCGCKEVFIPTPLVSVLFCLLFVHLIFFNVFRSLYIYISGGFCTAVP